MKIEKLNLEKALQSEWKEWKNYGKNRLYFNVEESPLLDLGFYKSGNINFSEFKGEKISHAEAGKLVASKIFIDLDTNELHVEAAGDEDMLDEIAKAAIEEVEEKEDEEKMAKLEVEVKETAEGITGNILDMELVGDNREDWAAFSDLFNDSIMSEDEYEDLCDIFNQHSTIEGVLKDLKEHKLIEDYEFLEGEDED
ncbi:hypothetical protein [Liquorilactobacillus capillatus]|uniref:Uncharacterized protein n=1 Tax=Liquorilactobacillus capillatus DSM 19910 TaxID=1423731 RepID=A0A0R1MFW6_9LACO|nr:hypothetical protein [Liquorilactobacillus capillatus]KRL02536.1 hypothetical protein FC81_GL000704 [Liquorilactobacillus capillatus DSM 19910]